LVLVLSGGYTETLIESCIVTGVICLIFLALFQLSQLFAAKEVLNYAAGRGARARTVGFNRFMVWKTVRVGSIPNAGLMVSPEFERSEASWGIGTPSELWDTWHKALTEIPASEQFGIEASRVPLYLGADWDSQLPAILDYDIWDTVEIPDPVDDTTRATMSQTVRQEYPLRLPMHRAFYDDDNIELSAEASLENHSSLYLTDMEL